jgi:hypothetical protein
MVKIMVSFEQLRCFRIFRDLIFIDASKMNDIVGFIFISACKRFLFKLVCFQHSNLMQSVSLTFKNFDPKFGFWTSFCP